MHAYIDIFINNIFASKSYPYHDLEDMIRDKDVCFLFFSSLIVYERTVLCKNFAILPETIEYYEFLLLFNVIQRIYQLRS